MKRLLSILPGFILLANTPMVYAQHDVVYSNFMANNGYFTDISHSWGSTDFTIAVPFTVPPGFNYCFGQGLGQVDFVVSQPNGSSQSHVTVVITELTPTGTPVFSASANSLPFNPQLISAFASGFGVLQGGRTYYLEITPHDAHVRWWGNNAGLEGEILTRDNTGTIPGFLPQPFFIPVFRILATPCSPPAVKPSYSAYATLGPTTDSDAEVRLEVICPQTPPLGQEPAPLFTCPVQIHVSNNATSSEVCQQLAAVINSHAYGCWFPPNVSNPLQPGAFHADCDGNNVRITNSELGLCPGAFVCPDVVENLTQFSNKQAARFSSYEYNGVRGPLYLEFGNVTSGIAANPALPDVIQIVHRGLTSGEIFTASVPLTPNTCPCKIGGLLVRALEADSSVVAYAKGIRFQPQEPYDITVSVNDTTVSWALSPFPNLLEQSVNHPPTVVPSCTSTSTQLCLHNNRFQVGAEWRTPEGATGMGIAVRTTTDSGYFTFFNHDNVELTVKILDACSYVQKLWFFAGGLTDVGVELTVTDTLTGQVRTYHHPVGTPFQPILDVEAFAGCS